MLAITPDLHYSKLYFKLESTIDYSIVEFQQEDILFVPVKRFG